MNYRFLSMLLLLLCVKERLSIPGDIKPIFFEKENYYGLTLI